MTHTAAEIANYLHATVEGDASVEVARVSGPEKARANDLIYVESEKHRPRAEASAAGCVLAPLSLPLAKKTVIRVAAPKLAFAKVAAWLDTGRRAAPGRHSTAVISPGARVAADASIGAYAVIEEGAVIGARSEIGAFCYVGPEALVGDDCRLHPHVTLYAGARLGNRVIIHSGSVIGGDGFGYVFGEGRHWKFPQIGDVQISDDVEIGCNTAVDRGSLGATVISQDVKIDNLVQVAHNVRIGEHSIIAAQTGISGSCTLGPGVVLGGQVGLGDHCTLEEGVIAGGGAGVLTGKTVQARQTIWGRPARPLERFKEQYAWYSRLPEIGKRLRKMGILAGEQKE